MKQVKINFELDIINLLKKGLKIPQIANHLNISMPNLSYYLSSLKKQNVIKKVGYGVWEIIPSGEVKILEKATHKANLQVKNKVKNVRGHAFIWKIKPNKKFNYIELLNSKNIKYELKGFSKTPRIILNNKKIWLGSNYITIFEPKINSYFETNTINSKKNAIYSLLEDITAIKSLFGEFRYTFTCRRQHYGFVNSPEALHFINKSKKILIKNEKGYWFSIDYSQNNYKESETIHEKDADIDGLGYQNLMNSHEKTNFKVTPDYILNGFNKLIQIQMQEVSNWKEYSKDIVEHKNAIKVLGVGILDLRKEVKKLNKTIGGIIKENKSMKLDTQKTLWDF